MGALIEVLTEQRRGWSLMIFCARATRGLRRVEGTARLSFLLAEAARSECAPSMRAVKGGLATPLGKCGIEKVLDRANARVSMPL